MTACMEWGGYTDKDGYGIMKDQGVNKRAHRVSYEMTKGSIPSGMVVMHTCDNPPCVNPDHLKCGTQAENVEDAHQKGRMRSLNGDSHYNARLTEDDVLAIRASGDSARDLAVKYGVAYGHIRAIITRVKWRHI